MNLDMLSLSNWPATVPPPLSVWGNGVVLPIIALVLIGLATSILTYWNETPEWGEHWLQWKVIKRVYHDRKATLALFCGLGGFVLKTWAIWYVRYLELHQISPREALPAAFAPVIFIIGTMMIAIGFACWLRVSLPDMLHNLRILPKTAMRGKPSQWVTAVVVIASCVWAIWMAN